jgi:alkylation response protein AidB-like acyl-CoA dehydrogenase
VAGGDTIMTLALTEESGSIEPSGIAVAATQPGEDFILNGTKLFVPDAHVADYIICVARSAESALPDDGISLFLVDARAEGVQTEVLKTMTGEKLCEVTFSSVAVPRDNLLGELHKGWPIIANTLDEATVAECAWMVGGARWVLETATDYAKERVQFGRPIGSFQAIQHKLADMAVEVEGATSITYYAAWAIAEDDPEKRLAASMAKAWCSDIYRHVTYDGLQIHGGIGFTWDHDMHLYLKRAKSSQIAFGDSDYHRERIAQMLEI